MKTIFKIITTTLCAIVLLVNCKKDTLSTKVKASNFPKEIGTLLISKCATPGCHTAASKLGAAGLGLETWEDLMNGGNGGAAVVPYQSEFSSLFLFCNTYQKLGQTSLPTMPVNAPPLTPTQMIQLRTWINQGAPDANGTIKWNDGINRRKFYVTNQACDLVSVFDAQTQLLIKNVRVGNDASRSESPHQLRVSHDNKYWYVLFVNGDYFEKYDASTDEFIARVNIGNSGPAIGAGVANGSWNTMAITKNDKYALLTDFSGGKVVAVDLAKMTVKKSFSQNGTPLFSFPHAIAITPDGDTCMVATQAGNSYYQFLIADIESKYINVQPLATPLSDIANSAGPHDMLYSPNGKLLFVTCQNTNEIAVYETATLRYIKSIATKKFPQELAISVAKNLLLVTCSEDESFLPKAKGCLQVIDINTLNVAATIACSIQPHGVVVDETSNLAYVTNRNIDVKGIAPHHVSYCGGKNGNLSVIDLNTLTKKAKNIELSVDPYFISIKY
jgi:DNA-binding beta-propeller fold protein YncE